MAKPTKNKFAIKYSIKEILLEEYHFYETKNIDFSKQDKFHYVFEGESHLDVPSKVIRIVSSYKFYNSTILLFDMKVTNDFKIHKDNEADLYKAHQEQKFIKTLVDISIDHARGIQSVIIKDTPFKNIYIPLVSSVELNKIPIENTDK